MSKNFGNRERFDLYDSENEELGEEYSDYSQEENPLESTRIDGNPLPEFQDLELEIPQNLDEHGLTQEVLRHIQNPDEYYDYSAVNLILETTAPQNVKVIPIEGGDRKIYLERAFREFRESNFQEAIIPIHNQNHFVGIYIKYNEEQERYEVLYFDPFGIESIVEIPEDIRDLLKRRFGVEEADIKFSRTAIQSQNAHCGPFTIFLLRAIANGDIEVQDQEIFARNQQGDFIKIDNLNAGSSDEFGMFLRQQDYKIATAQTEQGTEKDELEKLLAINYNQQFSSNLESSFNSSHNESSSYLGKVSGRNRSGDVSSMVVEFDEAGSTSKRKAQKNSGYDENFKTSEQRNGNWARIDGQLGLTEKDVRFAHEAFSYSRLPTSSYIHFRGENNETTGHSGGFSKSPEELIKTKGQGRLKKLFQEAGADHEKRREAANQVPTLLKSTTGGNTKGSAGFHAQRQQVVEKVVEEYKKKKKEERKQAVKASTVEALKFVVNNTVGFRDDTQANANRFKGITIDGLDISDPESRKFALKYYQAQRDLWKLAILKYQDRLNETDSESESEEQEEGHSDEEIARINRKLSRTKLEEKYHGHKHQAKRELSPLRAESPYSRSNVGNFIAKFQQAATYKDISTICATPVPAIRPKPKIQEAPKPETPHYAQPTESSQAKIKPKIKLKPIKPQKTSEAQEEFVSGIDSNPASIPTSTPKKIAFKKVEKPASQDQEK